MSEWLHFYAREDQLVKVPYAREFVGQPAKYVGRTKVAAGTDPDGKPQYGYAATKEGYKCRAGSREAQRCTLLTRRDASLFPADDATAKACGMDKAPDVEFDGDSWSLKQPKKSTTRSRASAQE